MINTMANCIKLHAQEYTEPVKKKKNVKHILSMLLYNNIHCSNFSFQFNWELWGIKSHVITTGWKMYFDNLNGLICWYFIEIQLNPIIIKLVH